MRKSLMLLAAVFVAACGGSGTGSGPSPSPVDVGSGSLTGAGSTFVQPFFQAAFYQYQQDHPNVSINYQGVGSGAGIQQFTANTVDFGASDVPMKASEVTAAGGDSSLVQLPDTLGAVAMGYNLPGVNKLQLDGPTIADIYLGKVKKWNDPEITALNSGVNLPSSNITVVHRSDGSGTSYIFTDYLSKVSNAWSTGPGKGKSVNWPTGVGAKGSSGVGGQITQTQGAIGYIELAYVVQSKMQQAYVKNQSGSYVQASVAGATAAASNVAGLSATNFSIVDASGASAYPISGYSWVFIRTDISSLEKARAIVYLFKWFVTDGQKYGTPLQYATLPASAQTYAINQLKNVMSGGKAVLS
ncbi:MAG TPA: phosphate ABC transporter substrate-binding protein PstS [Candidatus Dormibacteraeota bacterium]